MRPQISAIDCKYPGGGTTAPRVPPLIGSKMLGTLPPVLYGIFRYLYLIYDRKDTRSTDAILLEDYGMIGAAVTWVASVGILLAIYH